MYINNFNQFCTFAINKLSSLYRYRGLSLYSIVKNVYCPFILALKLLGVPSRNDISSQIFATENNSELVSSDDSNLSGLHAQALSRFRESVQEYKRIYSDSGNALSYHDQMIFLNRILAISRERNLPFLLVNLPLSSINKRLMKPGFYEAFVEEVRILASINKIIFVDAGQFKDNEDFWDTAHLNKTGGTFRIVRSLKVSPVKLLQT